MKVQIVKFVLGKGPVRSFKCSDRGPPVTKFLINRCLDYGKACVRVFLKELSTGRGRAINGGRAVVQQQAQQLATQSSNSTRIAAIKSGGVSSPTWKSLVSRMVSKCGTESLAADFRRNAAKRLMFGTGTSFALLGFGLAKEPTLLTEQDELEVICQKIREDFQITTTPTKITDSITINKTKISLSDLHLGKILAKGSNAVVYSGKWKTSNLDCPSTSTQEDISKGSFGNYDLAVKMMFNFSAESNATAIWRAMYRESIPAQVGFLPDSKSLSWLNKKYVLPEHPNIVEMKCAFADMVPDLPEGNVSYPDALPERLNIDGSGRNMTFFLVMKRYTCSLRDFLQDQKLQSTRVSIILLAQLLEGIVHLVKQGVAHRDLKSDNILLDLSYGEDNPHLVITDFGCCMADKDNGLSLPYQSDDVFKWGNLALMAPEVANAVPGLYSVIDYKKADLWAAGTIAYEIFGGKNPFYGGMTTFHLDSCSYTEQELPSLPSHQPAILTKLVKDLLKKDPKKRLDAIDAANICQMLLHGPPQWFGKICEQDPNLDFKGDVVAPSDKELLFWMVALAGVTFYFRDTLIEKDLSPVEQMLRSLYLSRVNIEQTKQTLSYICAA